MGEEQTLVIDGKPWRVRLIGDELTVIDDQGRMRNVSKGHMLTGMFLALALSKLPFESTPLADEALRALAGRTGIDDEAGP